MRKNLEEYSLHVKNTLKKFGYRNSLKREHIISILFESNEFLHAEEIKNKLLKEYGEVISLSMVYKHISLLHTLQLVQCRKNKDKKLKYTINI